MSGRFNNNKNGRGHGCPAGRARSHWGRGDQGSSANQKGNTSLRKEMKFNLRTNSNNCESFVTVQDHIATKVQDVGLDAGSTIRDLVLLDSNTERPQTQR